MTILLSLDFLKGGAVGSIYRYSHRFKTGWHIGIVHLFTFPKSLQSRSTMKLIFQTPIMVAHGQYDPVVPIQLGLASTETLKALGYKPEWHTYPIEHSVSLEEIKDIGNWINSILEK